MELNDYRGRTHAVEDLWPYDGPHSADTVTEAATAVAQLVRYLNNATQPHLADRTLQHAATIDRILGGIGSAVHGLRQLTDQLATAAEQQADNPTLYDDRRDRPPFRTAIRLAACLQDTRSAVGTLADDIDGARRISTHLGNEG